ncbi:MAG: glycosyltransferase family 39 protein, partial [Thermoanaerobaculia bacterium]|nr:glycosyltransferase family 39 protein [Thermoanaerobaculia bacterium]
MRRHALPLALATLVAVAGFPLLGHYNVTWDEALGDFFFGERYLSYFTSFDPAYLDFAGDPYGEGRRPDLSVAPFRDRPWEYYPVANTLAAATSTVLSHWAGRIDPFDGFHAVNLWLVAILLWALFAWTRRAFDTTAAVVACAVLVTSPRLVAHTLSNIKDVPEMVFFALSLLVFAHAWERGSGRGVIAAGLLWGLALGTKANALFVPPIALALALAARSEEGLAQRLRRLWPAVLASPILGFLLFLASWPYLWPDPVGRLGLHLEYIGLRLFATRPESIASPLGAVLYTTPVPHLLLMVAGLALAVAAAPRREVRWLLPL